MEYLDYLKSVRNLSDNTITAYQRDLKLFFDFLQKHHSSKEETASLRAFLTFLSRQGLSSPSINRIFASIRGYYRYRLRFGLASSDPSLGIRNFKTKRKLPLFLFEDEMRAFLDEEKDCSSARKKAGFMRLRDKAIFEFIYSTGCRVQECVAVNLSDLDLSSHTARITGKGKKERTVFLGGTATKVLLDYLSLRGAYQGHQQETALFINLNGGRISTRGVRYLLYKYLEAFGVKKRITVHAFRHSFATHILDKGADIRIVQELLGHSSLSTTQIYTHVGLQRLKEVYSMAHPRAKIIKQEDNTQKKLEGE